MSLINEALRKARLEAARQEASRRGLRYPAGEEPPRRAPLVPIVAAAVVVAIALGAVLLYRLGSLSARDRTEVVAATEPAAGAATEPGTPAAPRPPELDEPIIGDRLAPPANSLPTTRPERSPRSEPVPAEPAPRPAAAGAPSPTAQSRRETGADTIAPPRPEPARRPAAQPIATSPAGGARATEPSAPTRTADAPEPTGAVAGPVVTVDPPPLAAPTPAAATTETFVGEATIPGVGRLKLGGIAWSERQPFALINGRVVGPGDSIEGLQVDTVGRGEVILRGDGGATYTLRLR